MGLIARGILVEWFIQHREPEGWCGNAVPTPRFDNKSFHFIIRERDDHKRPQLFPPNGVGV